MDIGEPSAGHDAWPHAVDGHTLLIARNLLANRNDLVIPSNHSTGFRG